MCWLGVLWLAGGRALAEPFQPIKEAEMPGGFPGYTPVGQIEVKHYPAYRKASTAGAGEFWALFGHIKKNGVEMTAPVEVDYGDPLAENPADRSMSFLYPSAATGSTGKQGRVEVSDVPAMSVVSIGCRGRQMTEAIAAARQKLLDYLAERKDQYTISGSMRVMGYNSPFVPRDKNFFEVQIPVKFVDAQ
jgi:effector-binding domain-containing protein